MTISTKTSLEDYMIKEINPKPCRDDRHKKIMNALAHGLLDKPLDDALTKSNFFFTKLNRLFALFFPIPYTKSKSQPRTKLFASSSLPISDLLVYYSIHIAFRSLLDEFQVKRKFKSSIG
ncbi:unnamed protein product [Vicia faba]|uniref:Uncharacterized protein n=1 Tax=Vicia faba TaxID=3906 RepID=A0AAV0ZWF0_VICFA|nr:unnamed protein product [Vicia faba]